MDRTAPGAALRSSLALEYQNRFYQYNSSMIEDGPCFCVGICWPNWANPIGIGRGGRAARWPCSWGRVHVYQQLNEKLK